ncbi:hypothetical protein HXA33_01875 [Salipaludibacillus agaradhaerens]|uniref:Uncharacterized protein n=2 Tax=Salipaludibacillus agaradhaerens TaxID=76935 RepID=A0A9Q4FXB5_SALAG|nr:hypothetical protein [Salipaludibacillus agaradhaerens]
MMLVFLLLCASIVISVIGLVRKDRKFIFGGLVGSVTAIGIFIIVFALVI